MIGLLIAAVVVLIAWWVLRRLVMLLVVAALLIGAAVWASDSSVRHHGQATVSRQLHRLERKARHDATRGVRHDTDKVASRPGE